MLAEVALHAALCAAQRLDLALERLALRGRLICRASAR